MKKSHLLNYEDNVEPKVNALLEKWEKEGGVNDLFKDIRNYTFSILCEAVLGVEVEDNQREKLAHAFDIINRETPKNVVLSPLNVAFNVPFSRKFTGAKDFVMAFLDNVCEQYLDAPQTGNLMCDILSSVGYYDNPTHENKCKAYEQIFHIFIAGFETTANTLVWILSEYARRPEWQKATVDELNELQLNSSQVGINDLRNLKVQKSFIDEVLRLYAPIYLSFPRIAKEDMQLNGSLPIKKGDVVFVSIDAIHRDPRWWPDPEVFDPNRHVTKTTKDRPKNSFLPFYIGGHRCTGAMMFNMEALPIISGILSKYEISLASEFPKQKFKTIMTVDSRVALDLRERDPVHNYIPTAQLSDTGQSLSPT